MPRRAPLLCALLTLSAVAQGGQVTAPPLPLRTLQFDAPDLVTQRLPKATGRMGAVEQYGEIVILEGDDLLVSDDGSGRLGVVLEGGAQNPVEITNRFFSAYPDEFDEVIVYTTFRDYGTPGALAYEMSVTQDVEGIGRGRFFQGTFWGGSRLFAFVNMKSIDQYQQLDGRPISDPASSMYPVLAQEFAHRWLSFLTYRREDGNVSSAMLGRDKAHWASTLQAEGSVMDGNQWRDNGDGTFTIVAKENGFSPLDLYGMGLIPADKVPPWYLIRDAVNTRNGQKVDPANSFVNVGTTVRGSREEIKIEQVVSALGARKPGYPQSPRDFRVAFVLLTRPGETASQVLNKASLLDTVRKNWEQIYRQYTGGVSTVCTQVSAPCGTPAARVVGGTVEEAGAVRNGVIEPGERIAVTFELRNDGSGPAAGIQVTASAPEVTFDGPRSVARLDEGGSAKLTFLGTVSKEGKAVCGRLITVRGESRLGPYRWRGFTQLTPGTRAFYRAAFDDGAGFWGANLDGKDTALANAWQWGRPRGYRLSASFSLQPDGGAGGTSAWFTGLERGNFGTGATASLPLGVAKLWSPRLDLRQALRPRLAYQAWFVALDFSEKGRPPSVAGTDHLILEGSNDGVGWLKLDQVDGQDDRWQPRDVDLERVLDLGQLKREQPLWFRFRVNRNGEEDLVEAGVDDFTVISDVASCAPAAAAPPDPPPAPPELPPLGACALAPARSLGGLGLAAVALLALAARARRRRS